MATSLSESRVGDSRRRDAMAEMSDRPARAASRQRTARSAVRMISLCSLLAGLPWAERLLAAGLGATLAVLAAIIALQLLCFLAFWLVGLFPLPDQSMMGDEIAP
jgi:hypothetical protein